MFSIRLSREDLERFFTINAAGERLTLDGFIKQREAQMHKEEIVGAAGAGNSVLASEDPNFSAQDINDLVEQYLQSMDEREVLEIAGGGSFDKEQLMIEVEQRTSVGLQVIEMILADRRFVERQIKNGNYSYPKRN